MAELIQPCFAKVPPTLTVPFAALRKEPRLDGPRREVSEPVGRTETVEQGKVGRTARRGGLSPDRGEELLEDVKNQLGHSSIVLTSNTYGHVLEQRQQQVAQGMDGVLGG